eukprot:2413205-Rhodomonas_salina.1
MSTGGVREVRRGREGGEVRGSRRGAEGWRAEGCCLNGRYFKFVGGGEGVDRAPGMWTLPSFISP